MSVKKVLFVCLGNICRSPLAEGLFRHHVNSRGLNDQYSIDSCGTGSWHLGDPPDERSIEVARANGIDISRQKARKLDPKDGEAFDLIVAMDRANKRDIQKICNITSSTKLVCLREYDMWGSGKIDVPDPYYGEVNGFVEVFNIVDRSTRALLDSLED